MSEQTDYFWGSIINAKTPISVVYWVGPEGAYYLENEASMKKHTDNPSRTQLLEDHHSRLAQIDAKYDRMIEEIEADRDRAKDQELRRYQAEVRKSDEADDLS